MIKYLLDTDILSMFQMKNQALITRVSGSPAGEIGITVISVEEQMSGWYTKLRQSRKRDQLISAYQRLTESVQSLARFPIHSFDGVHDALTSPS